MEKWVEIYLLEEELIAYWTSFSLAIIVVVMIASAAGGLLITPGRAVLTVGITSAFALVPGAAIVGIGLAAWNLALVEQGFLRWICDHISGGHGPGCVRCTPRNRLCVGRKLAEM